VRVKRWEVGAACLGVAFALIFVFSNAWGIGVGLLCAAALWLLTRVEIVEKAGAPGRYAAVRGRLGLAKLILLLGVYAAVMYGLVIAHRDASGLRVGVVASFALAGLAFMLLGELNRSGDDMIRWLAGARAERKVGAELDRLRESGWLVLHGYKRDWGGDIDHIVCGPGGIFMVETKSYEFRRSDIRRAAWNAAWMKEKLEVTWVTGVLCVNEDRAATLDGRIWVVGHAQLVPWLQKQRNAPIDCGRVREAFASPVPAGSGSRRRVRGARAT
jgi:Nuclease-related domain